MKVTGRGRPPEGGSGNAARTESTGGTAPPRRRSGAPTDDELAAAGAEALELVYTVIGSSQGDASRPGYVLCLALAMYHGVQDAERRAGLEERIRRMLAGMYAAPAFEKGTPVVVDMGLCASISHDDSPVTFDLTGPSGTGPVPLTFHPWEDIACGGCQLSAAMRATGNAGPGGSGCADHEEPGT